MMGSTAPLVFVALLLFYLPWRVSRGFHMGIRVGIVMLVVTKAVLIVIIHLDLVDRTSQPIILDTSVDAKDYYDFGEAFLNQHLMDITHDDLVRERQALGHLGYPVVNLLAFKICPQHPILFLRLFKLLLFHVALGMLASTWRIMATPTRAAVGYFVLGAVFYQFFYFTFRNLKDDLLLSLFMMIMALADRTFSADRPDFKVPFKRMIGTWIVIGALLWVISTIRFYLTLALVGSFAMHVITGRGLKFSYRLLFTGAIAGAFAFLVTTQGFQLVQSHGGASAVVGSAGNIYGLFKIFVRPLPWQHVITFLAIPHTFYLFLLPVALIAFFSRLRSNLNWKLYLVGALALVLGAFMRDYEPRKRYFMYPIFVGWIVMAGLRRETAAALPPESEPFDPNAYFADARNVYT